MVGFLSNLILVTIMVLVFCGIDILVSAWYLGNDYEINGNVGKRYNAIEKWLDGFKILLKM